jgi:hypothetical protein
MQKFSLAVAKIEMLHLNGVDSIVGAQGTAFFYKSTNDIMLVTNWHNVTGVDPINGKVLHSHGLIPNVLRIHYKTWENADRNSIKSQYIDIFLYEEDRPIWFEHSSRQDVDVVIIRLQVDKLEGFANECINSIRQEQNLEVYPGMDCFILGFPEGLIGAANTPIWKRGSIAAEPYQKYPYYVDSATRKGMSGSPVIARHSGIFGVAGSVLTGGEVIGTVEKFVAIYSGRVGDDALGFQLGTAWQSNVLEDILTLATHGEHPLL